MIFSIGLLEIICFLTKKAGIRLEKRPYARVWLFFEDFFGRLAQVKNLRVLLSENDGGSPCVVVEVREVES